MLFHSLRAKVLSSLHNNTQQPFIKSPEARVLLLLWLLIWEKTARLSLPITRTTPAKQHTCLRNLVVKLVGEIVSLVVRVL